MLRNKLRHMSRPGPKRKVSDLRLLFEVMVADRGAVFAAEITDQVDLKTTQGVRDRLNDLADGPYLDLETVANRNLYRLTDQGQKYLNEEIRSSLDQRTQ